MLELLHHRLSALEEEYLEKPVRVLVLRDHTLTLPGGSVELRKGTEMEIPRRAARLLQARGVVEVRDEGLKLEDIARIHFSEMETRSPAEIARLPPDFYMRAKEYMALVEERLRSLDPQAFEEKKRAELFLSEIISHRLSLILRLLQSGVKLAKVMDKLTPEEQVLYEALSTLLEEWRKRVAGYLEGGEG